MNLKQYIIDTMKTHTLPLVVSAVVGLNLSVYTQQLDFNVAGDWSVSTNWSPQDVADNNTENVRIQANANVDSDFTINRIQNSFGGNGTVSGPGTLTLDRNNVSTLSAISNVNGSGVDLNFGGNVTISNSAGGRGLLDFGNSSSNSITFATGSTLNLVTQLETRSGTAGQAINFNGDITGGNQGPSAGLVFGTNSNNITFGTSSDNSGYTGDFAFNANASIASNSTTTGGFLSSGKIQINGSGSELTLGGANIMQGNVVFGGSSNAFTLNVDADQTDFGFITLGSGNLTLDLDAGVNSLFFADSSATSWTTGAISINGFREGVIKFGTTSDGLSGSQLDAIDGGIYSLSGDGFLTAIPEPGTLTLLVISAAGFLFFRRRKN